MRRILVASAQSPIDATLGAFVVVVRTLLIKHLPFVVLCGCYLVFGLAGSLWILPWQSPDEPAHFEHAVLTSYGTNAELPQVQGPIIATFAPNRFYELRNIPTPDEPPKLFSDLGWRIIRQTDKTPVYYQLVGGAAAWTNDTLLKLYSMRWLSVLCSALTLPLAYLLALELLPIGRERLGLLAAAIVALLPMYSYIGASVNPDTLGAPFAAAATLFAVRAIRGKRPFLALMLAVALACATIWVRRSGIFLVPWASLLVLFLGGAWAWRKLPHRLVVAAGALVVGITIVVLIWPSRLAADWYADPGTQVSLTAPGFKSHSAFALTAHADGTPAQISQQISRDQIEQLRGAQLHISAMAKGPAGAVTVANQAGTVATSSVTTADWQPIERSVSVPTNSTALYIIFSGTTDQPIAFDNVMVSNATSNQPVALSNGGAEDSFTWWQARYSQQTFVDYVTRILRAVRMGVYVSPQALELYPTFIDQLTSSLIGRFGWMAFGPPGWLTNSVRVLAIVAIGGLLLIGRRAQLDGGQRRAVLALVLLIVAGVITILLEYLPYLSASTFPQGRYLFPFLGAMAALVVCGSAHLVPARYDRALLIGGMASLLGFGLYCWFVIIIPFFYA